jgi:hypothetical protein
MHMNMKKNMRRLWCKIVLKIGVEQIEGNEGSCHNPNLGFTTKAKTYKGAGQEGSPRVTSHAPESERECEGMNPHTPK